MTTEKPDLEAIRKRAAAASAEYERVRSLPEPERSEKIPALLAELRFSSFDIPALLARVEELEEENNSLREDIDEIRPANEWQARRIEQLEARNTSLEKWAKEANDELAHTLIHAERRDVKLEMLYAEYLDLAPSVEEREK